MKSPLIPFKNSHRTISGGKYSNDLLQLPGVKALFPELFPNKTGFSSSYHDLSPRPYTQYSVTIQNLFDCIPAPPLDTYNYSSESLTNAQLVDPTFYPMNSIRTRLTSTQTQFLAREFQNTMFPSTELRNELSKMTGLCPRTVQIWFQNQRQKRRIQSKEKSHEKAKI